MDRSKKRAKIARSSPLPPHKQQVLKEIIRQEKAASFSPLLPRCPQPAPLQPLDSPPLPENNGIKFSSDECNFPAELLSNLLWLSSSTWSSSSSSGKKALDVNSSPVNFKCEFLWHERISLDSCFLVLFKLSATVKKEYLPV